MGGLASALTSVAIAVAALFVFGRTQSAQTETQRRIYKDGEQVYPAAWTRDGNILVTVVRQKGPEILLLTSDGRLARSVRGPTPNSWAADVHPSGTRVLVESYDGGVSDVYDVSLATGESSRMTRTPWNEWHPSWSPDGQSIVFDSDSGGRGPRLVLVDVESSATSHATRSTRAEQGGRWSPNGKQLVFHRHMGSPGDTNYDVFVLDRVAGTETQLTSDPADTSSPSWSPDGRRVAFSSNRAGAFDIYVACADGTSATKMTTGAGDKRYPVWSPDGRRIAYQAHGDGIWSVTTDHAPRCAGAAQ